MFSHALKKNVARVNVSDHRKARSPLLQEVLPEDIVDERSKEWTEMDEEDYDGNYVASTDPIHPVSTDYSHPLDDDDGSWMLNHFSSEELEEQADAAVAVDFDGHAWSWGEDSADNRTTEVPTEWKEEHSNDDTGQWHTTDGFIAWGPEADATAASAVLDINGLRTEKTTMLAERVQEVVKAFWEVVNNIDNDQRSQHPKDDLNTLLHGLHISSPSTVNSTPPSSPTTPTNTLHQWVDGPSDSPSSWPSTFQSPPPLSLIQTSSNLPSSTSLSNGFFSCSSPPCFPQRPPTPPSPNPTRARYDKQRKYLKARNQDEADLTKYYSDWLLVSRWEARDFEGPKGRFVPDPQMVRVGGGKGGSASGWF
jgi:hypothetical protein